MAVGKHSQRKMRFSRRKSSRSTKSGLDQQTIGTHVSRFSGMGKHGRASGGLSNVSIDTVNASSNKNKPTNILRKKRQSTLAEQLQGKVNKRFRIVFLVIIIFILLVAAGVGVFAYFKTANDKLDLHPSNAKDSLIEVKGEDPFYILCCAVLGTPFDTDNATNMAYMLVRVDSQTRTTTFITIPSNLQVRIANGDYLPLYKTSNKGGDAQTIKALAATLDIEINHFAYTTVEKLGDMVDMVGGISLNLIEEVDDPSAGIKVLYPGQQKIDGAQARVLLRANNYYAGFNMVAQNRVDFTLSLVERALANNGPGYATLIGDAGDYVSTDLDAATLLKLGDIFTPIETIKVYECVLPGYEVDDMTLGETVYVRSRDTWSAMLALINAGDDPNNVEASPVNVEPSSFTIEVRNGSNSNGAAARMAEMLKRAGYVVKSIGNAEEGIVYPETLIVYTDEKYEGAALSIIETIGDGRAVNGGDFYSSEANVIAIIGADYIPIA